MTPADAPPMPRRIVRVTGCHGSNVIEFELAIGSPVVIARLMLPEPAFADFCRHNDFEIHPATSEHDPGLEADQRPLAWSLRAARSAAG